MEQNKINLSIPHPKFIFIQAGQAMSHLFSQLALVISNFLRKLRIMFLRIPQFRRKEVAFSSMAHVGTPGSQNGLSDKLNKQSLRLRLKRNIKKAVVLILGLLILVLVIRSIRVGGGTTDSSGRVTVKGAKATSDLNREFSFPVRSDSGDEITSIKFVIEKVELRDEIVVQGQKATAVEGRTFLILNIKITNDFDSALEINTKDYVRLSVNGRGEWLAPDIHNDPVEVQAISTKQTRLGFPVNDTDKNLRLKIGEIDGQKEEVEISF